LLSVSSVGQIAFVANMRANNYLEEGEFSRGAFHFCGRHKDEGVEKGGWVYNERTNKRGEIKS
jgi:hypothetical protein